MKKLCLCLFLILGGCTAKQELVEEVLQYNYEAMPDEVFSFYQALDLSTVTADVMHKDGIKEYKITSFENLTLFSEALQDIDTGYLYARPEDALYIIYQLKDKNDNTYILESYIDGSDIYYCVNEFDLAFKTSNSQLYDVLLNNNDEEIKTEYYINTMPEWTGRRGLIDGLFEEGLVKYADENTLTKDQLLKNDSFLAELISEFDYLDNRDEMEAKIVERYGAEFNVELPVGPVRYSYREYTYNPDTNAYDINSTSSEYIKDYIFAVAESKDTVICMRYKANDIFNRQSVIQMYGNENKYRYINGLEILTLLLYHIDEVDLIELNKSEWTSRIIKKVIQTIR